jgi:hypothetical protein
MSILTHVRNASGLRTPNIGRPPYDAVPSRRCDMVRTFDDGREHQCWSGASWLLPEMSRCAHHVPAEYLPVLQERARHWAEYAAMIWDDVVRDHPI